jgi:hypothetical protein
MIIIKLTNEHIDNYLIENNRKIIRLSNYRNSREIMKWECIVNGCGKIWLESWNVIQQGSGCPRCAGLEPWVNDRVDRYLIDNCRNILRLSECTNNRMMVKWRCIVEGCEYIWETTFQTIKLHGCPRCSRKERWTNEKIDENLLGSHRNILRLSDYINNKTIMKWECTICRRIWNTRWNKIQRKQGCPYCTKFHNENICREFMERIFDSTFIKCSPGWLKGQHFDGYSEKLNIAFECNGEQHYGCYPRFHNDTPSKFEMRQKLDERKIRIADEYNIILIIIPYWIENDKKEQFIIEEYKKKTGIEMSYRAINWKIFPTHKQKELEKINELCNKINYKCISTMYFTNQTKLDFKCNKEHFFSMRPNSFKRGVKCPICHNKNRGEITSRSNRNRRKTNKFEV